jgi:hypothetical protein
MRGFYWHPRSGKWQAKMIVDGKQKHIGYYPTPEEAQRAHEAAVNAEQARRSGTQAGGTAREGEPL